MSILNTLIKSVYAADITVNPIKGIGDFGFENKNVSGAETETQFGTILSSLITTITVIGGLAFVIFFTLGGLKWLTSGGDKTKVEEAKTQMTQGVIGLVAIVAALFVVGVVGNVLGIDILNPFKTLFSSTPKPGTMQWYDQQGNI